MKTIKKIRMGNLGLSLVELIIAITIIAILVGVFAPQYIRYVYRAQKSTDLATADSIGRAFERAIMYNEEAYKTWEDWKPGGNLCPRVTVTVNGKSDSYNVYMVMSSETKGFFSGTTNEFKKKYSDGKCFYDVINDEMGFMYSTKGNKDGAQNVNEIMIPKYKVKGLDGVHEVDRWRICKNKNNGRVEIWSAYDRGQGSGDAGGRPCYRVWPDPDDIYTRRR